MKAAVYLGGPKNIRVQEVPDPVPKEGEILVKIGAANICGVDSRTYNHGDKKITPPRILGHEFAGTVVEVAGKHTDIKAGDRVTAYVVLPCGSCVYCKRGRANLCDTRTTISYHHDGAFADYMVIPRQAVENRHVFRIPLHTIWTGMPICSHRSAMTQFRGERTVPCLRYLKKYSSIRARYMCASNH